MVRGDTAVSLDGPVRWDPLIGEDVPYPVYRRLRDEAPLYHDSERGIWAFSRFDDVQRAARDWEAFSSRQGNDHDDTYQLFLPAGDLAGTDPPTHTRLRRALHRAFNPSEVATRFEPSVRVIARRLIDRFADRGHADSRCRAREAASGRDRTCTWLGFPKDDHPQLLAWFGQMLERTPGVRALPASALDARDRCAPTSRTPQRTVGRDHGTTCWACSSRPRWPTS